MTLCCSLHRQSLCYAGRFGASKFQGAGTMLNAQCSVLNVQCHMSTYAGARVFNVQCRCGARAQFNHSLSPLLPCCDVM